jgi:hypothetical protein
MTMTYADGRKFNPSYEKWIKEIGYHVPEEHQFIRQDSFEAGHEKGFSKGYRLGIMAGVISGILTGVLSSILYYQIQVNSSRGLERNIETSNVVSVEDR